MKFKPSKLVPVSAAVLLAFGSLCAIGAPVTPLTLGDTLLVSGAAPADATPTTSCTLTATANTYTCDNLRSAIAHANANAAPTATYTRIVLDNGSTHTLSVADSGATEAIDAYDNLVGDLDVTAPVTIDTTDNTLTKATIEGGTGFNDRLLHINSTANLTNLTLTKGQGVHMNGGAIYGDASAIMAISRSVLTDNSASWDGDYVDPAIPGDTGTTEFQGSGGAIYTKGPLTITFSTVSKNTARTVVGTLDYQKNGNGGAIYASQALTISDSTIGGTGVANDAINGGAIFLTGGQTMTIERTTISHNTSISGGAMNIVSPSSGATITNSTISANFASDAGAGINVNGNITIGNTTIAGNLLESAAAGKGSGLNQFNAGVATMHNTLFSGNLSDTLGANTSANCGKTGTSSNSVASSGGNLSTDATCKLLDGTDQQGVLDAKIGPLALNDNTYNGNLTHALLTGSPAVNKGTTSACPATDERNVARPQGSVCDVGAYELIIPPATSSSSSGCSVASGKTPFDPMLPALAALGFIGLALRRARRS